MTKLDDDVDAYVNAADAAGRQTALVQWMRDVNASFDLVSDKFTQSSQEDQAMTRTLRKLELLALRHGLVWNPKRLAELTSEDD